MSHKENDVRYLSPEESSKYLTLKEAAALSDYSADYIGQLIRQGKLEGFQVYTNVSWVTTEKALREYVDSRGKRDESETDLWPWQRNPQAYVRGGLYVVIGCLVCVLLAFMYILAVGLDHKVSESSLNAFDARTTHVK